MVVFRCVFRGEVESPPGTGRDVAGTGNRAEPSSLAIPTLYPSLGNPIHPNGQFQVTRMGYFVATVALYATVAITYRDPGSESTTVPRAS